MPAMIGKEKAFILIVLLFLMVLLAVTAMALNSRTALQARMVLNQTTATQMYFDQMAVIEQSLWELTLDPSLRIAAWDDHPYGGLPYQRSVTNPDGAAYPALASFADAVTIAVKLPDGTNPMKKSFRYYVDTPFMVRKPRQVVDIAGNVFFADPDNHSVWKIEALSGAITRIAGTGMSGFSGDGGAANQARLNKPTGICVDASGHVYIADTDNHRLRKVNTLGMITTVAGTGETGHDGDGGPAVSAQLGTPQGLAADSFGNLYIAQRAHSVIRKLELSSGVISRVAGTGIPGNTGDGGPAVNALLREPEALFVDQLRNLYIADTDNHAIRKVDASTQNISTIAGTLNNSGFSGDGGPAVNAKLNRPAGVYVSASGDIFIADTDNCRIRKVTVASGVISTHAGTGVCGYDGDGAAPTVALINKPTGICGKTGGGLIIADTENSCLRRVEATISIIAQTAQRFALSAPGGVDLYYDPIQGKLFLYIADSGNHRIWRIDTLTNVISTAAGTGSAGCTGDTGPAISAQLSSPARVAVDSSGNLYIADTANCWIRKVDAAGIITRVAGTVKGGGEGDCGYSGDDGDARSAKLAMPTGISLDAAGNIYIADTDNHRIRKVTAATGIISTVVNTAGQRTSGGHPKGDGGAATAATLSSPQGVSLDAAGNIYIADTDNHGIRKVTASTGIISTIVNTASQNTSGGHPKGDGGAATAATLSSPRGVSVDAAGNIYVSDTGNHSLRLVSVHDNTITTMAGTGAGGYNGDGQPAVQARLDSPGGAALGLAKGGGRIYVSDSQNNRIRMLFLRTVPEIYGP